MKNYQMIRRLQIRIAWLARQKRIPLVSKLLRPKRKKGYVHPHEKMLKGNMSILQRLKRYVRQWKQTKKPVGVYRPPQKSRLTKRKMMVWGGVLACLIMLFSSWGMIKEQLVRLDGFSLTTIRITGCVQTTTDKIREYGQIKYNSRLSAIDTLKIQKRLETHPWIEKAVVSKKFPDTLKIDIKEYCPAAVLQLAEGGKKELFYVDRWGTPFVQPEAGQDMDFPVITGLEALNREEGLRPQLQSLMEFLKLVSDRDDPNLPGQSVSQIHVDPQRGVMLFLVDFPFPIILGKGDLGLENGEKTDQKSKEVVKKRYKQLKKVIGFLYQERKRMNMNSIAYVRMDYADEKVLVAHTEQVSQ